MKNYIYFVVLVTLVLTGCTTKLLPTTMIQPKDNTFYLDIASAPFETVYWDINETVIEPYTLDLRYSEGEKYVLMGDTVQ